MENFCKPEELRVGNWVNTNIRVALPEVLELHPIQLELRHFKHMDEGDKFYPIGLTPEILEKAGFDNTKGGCSSNYKYWSSNGLIDVRFREDGFTVFQVGGGVMTERNHIKYLHQLQNLYFALTENELEINLSPLSQCPIQ